ncbi:MAG: glutamyl-tRNA reductase [Actinomycetota bacterium]|nr:glutamyl-tRNA reductase [Actinomycetota bacterium]
MHIIVMGLSHKTAPVEIREKLTFPESKLEESLQCLLKYDHISEGVILSTCNRTEIYAVSDDPDRGKEDLIKFLSQYHNLDPKKFRNHLYFRHSIDVIHHLFEVVTSLDSMVVGEAQILGQVKGAYAHAFEAHATSVIFNRLFRHAFKVGKRVRTETGIGESAVSVSYVAVELAKKVFEDLAGRTVMIIGAGEMSELTAKHLVANGVTSVLVSNRTYERAVELANRFHGKAVKFDEFPDYMVDTDIVISSTGAPHYIVKRKTVAEAMRRRRFKPIFLIDIAVPRDIDPEVNKIYNVFLFDIDDLQSVVDANLAERAREARKAELIIDREVEEFMAWLSSLEVVPTIAALRKRAELIRKGETEKALNKLGELSEREKNIINALTGVIINKLLHEPIVRIKECSRRKDGYLYIESLRHLFDLEAMERGRSKGEGRGTKGEGRGTKGEGRKGLHG